MALCLSIYFIVYHYEKMDTDFENEKLRISEFMIENLDGKVMRSWGPSTEYIDYKLISSPPGKFKEYTISNGIDSFQKSDKKIDDSIFISGDSLNEIISDGQKYELKYIVAYKNENTFHGFLDDLYANEEKYPFMIKIFDSNYEGFEKIKMKIFQIDYGKFVNQK